VRGGQAHQPSSIDKNKTTLWRREHDLKTAGARRRKPQGTQRSQPIEEPRWELICTIRLKSNFFPKIRVGPAPLEFSTIFGISRRTPNRVKNVSSAPELTFSKKIEFSRLNSNFFRRHFFTPKSVSDVFLACCEFSRLNSHSGLLGLACACSSSLMAGINFGGIRSLNPEK